MSNRVELLLMTMSQDIDVRSSVQCLLENQGDVIIHDEGTLVACQRAAEQGFLMAQLALAQFYSANRTNPSDVIHTYAWYSIVCERISRDWKDVAKTMTVEQVLQAEQIATKWLDNRGKATSVRTNGEAPHRRSVKTTNLARWRLVRPSRRLIKHLAESTRLPIGADICKTKRRLNRIIRGLCPTFSFEVAQLQLTAGGMLSIPLKLIRVPRCRRT